METLANIIANASTTVAETSSSACMLWLIDEPECPKSLIK